MAHPRRFTARDLSRVIVSPLGQLDRHRSVRQLNRLFSLCLRPVARRLFYLPGLAGRRGLGRAFDIGAALIEPLPSAKSKRPGG